MRIGREAFTPNPRTRVLEDFPQIKEGAGGDKQDGEDGRGGDSGRKEERGVEGVAAEREARCCSCCFINCQSTAHTSSSHNA